MLFPADLGGPELPKKMSGTSAVLQSPKTRQKQRHKRDVAAERTVASCSKPEEKRLSPPHPRILKRTVPQGPYHRQHPCPIPTPHCPTVLRKAILLGWGELAGLSSHGHSELGKPQKGWTFYDPWGGVDLEDLGEKGRFLRCPCGSWVSGEAWLSMVRHVPYLGAPQSIPTLTQQRLLPKPFTVLPQEASCGKINVFVCVIKQNDIYLLYFSPGTSQARQVKGQDCK